jgi:hypothetical protein
MQRVYETCLGQPEKSVMVEHSAETGHRIDFISNSILGKVM